MLSLRPRRHAVALVIALIGVCALASPAGAATKPYSVVISPNTVPAGASVPFQATITNRTTSQTLGSADLTPPPDFTVGGPVSVGVGDASVSANVVHLRNLAIAPGASVTATFMVKVPASQPCAPATFTWKVEAKQSNDFNGTGNNFGPQVDSSVTTSTTCDGTATQCTAASCLGTLNDADASISVNVLNSTGLLTISRGGGIDCVGYQELLAQDFIVDFLANPGTTGGTKTVTVVISKEIMNTLPANGAALLNMCFAAPFPFAIKPGSPQHRTSSDSTSGCCRTAAPRLAMRLQAQQDAGQARAVIVVQAPGRRPGSALRPVEPPGRYGQRSDRGFGQRDDVQAPEQGVALGAARCRLGPSGT